jgi:hypothetical protein
MRGGSDRHCMRGWTRILHCLGWGRVGSSGFATMRWIETRHDRCTVGRAPYRTTRLRKSSVYEKGNSQNAPSGTVAGTTTGCSKSPSSKAAASGEARRTGWYVEPLREARTPLAGFFSILLEERRHGTWFAAVWHMALCRKPPCPTLPSEAEKKAGMKADHLLCSRNARRLVCLVRWSFWSIWFFW